MGPYPFTVTMDFQSRHDRVSVEDAPVKFPHPANPLLHVPNEITERDFEGWVQERGLYFASKWDPHYETVLECHDPGEPPEEGGMLYARYGKGVYIFSAYSWFRQLPAGVPGAYRIFANMLSAGMRGSRAHVKMRQPVSYAHANLRCSMKMMPSWLWINLPDCRPCR